MKSAKQLIPNNLRKYRQLFKYEQLDVAYLLGQNCHKSLSDWERGLCMPSATYLLKLSIIYRTLPDELYYDLRREFVDVISEREKSLLAKRDMGG
jgi:transcriptional regulator with XRE-family HTH domain